MVISYQLLLFCRKKFLEAYLLKFKNASNSLNTPMMIYARIAGLLAITHSLTHT